MTNQVMPAQAEPIVSIVNQSVTALSIDVAEYFGKDHAHVMRDIRNLIGQEPKLGQSNFGSSNYVDSQGKTRPCYSMDRKGFVLLAMGFTGEKALKFKIAYIDAFDAMEAKLRNQPVSTPTQTQGLSAEQTYMIQSKISKIAKGEAHIYRNIYSALKRKFGVKKYVDIPSEHFWDAISFLNNCELEETLTPMQKIEALAIAQKIKIVSEGFVEGVFTLVKYHRMFTQKQERLYYLIDQICDELKKSSTFLWDAAHEPTFALHKVCKELAELGYDVGQNEPKQITNKQ